MPPSQRTMRRSCQFCRSRKIKCSGQDKCDVCRERNIDCVYGQEASKGRPRKRPGTADTSSSIPTQHSSPNVILDMGDISNTLYPPTFNLEFSSEFLSDAASPNTTYSGMREDFDCRIGSQSPMPSPGVVDFSLASELEHTFQQYFGPLSSDKRQLSIYQEAVVEFDLRKDISCATYPEVPHGTSEETPKRHSLEFKCAILSYDEILSVLTHQLVEILITKYGTLGCHYLAESNSDYYIRALARDTQCQLFPPESEMMESPLRELDTHRTLQLIESWFSMHPLANILSKTIFLRQFRSGAHDQMLLSLILSDALYIGGDTQSVSKAERLFNFAIHLFHSQAFNHCDLAQAQALTLLGWHELCLGNARAATCFLRFGCKAIGRVISQVGHDGTTGFSRINGIDVGEVESELMYNIYWFLFSTTLWCFMQLDQPIDELLPSSLHVMFPPVDQTNSVVHKLDMVSGNIGSFRRQARMMRELWTLSQIASTIGHVYSFFPKHTHDATKSSSSPSWQAKSLHPLRSLSNPPQDILALSSKMRRILQERTADITTEKVPSPMSRITLWSAYHTIIIHMLSPQRYRADNQLFPQSGETEVGLTDGDLDTFINSAQALIELTRWFGCNEFVIGSETIFHSTNASIHPDFNIASNMFVLGLDACSRFLDSINREFVLQISTGGERYLQLNQRRLQISSIAHELKVITKLERLSTARRIRAVKKDIKRVNERLFRRGGREVEHTYSFDLSSMEREAVDRGAAIHTVPRPHQPITHQQQEDLQRPHEFYSTNAPSRVVPNAEFAATGTRNNNFHQLRGNFLDDFNHIAGMSMNLDNLDTLPTMQHGHQYDYFQQNVSRPAELGELPSAPAVGTPYSERIEHRHLGIDHLDHYTSIAHSPAMEFWDIPGYPTS